MTINKNKNKDLFVVYVASYGGDVYYVGQGIIGREKHVNSGCSHVYDMNKMHFEGRVFDIKLEKYEIKQEAIQREAYLIETLSPKFNKVGTERDGKWKRRMLSLLKTFTIKKAKLFLRSKKCTEADIERLTDIMSMNKVGKCVTGIAVKNTDRTSGRKCWTILNALAIMNKGGKLSKGDFLSYFYYTIRTRDRFLMLSDSLLADFKVFLNESCPKGVEDFEKLLQERHDTLKG